MDVCESFRYGAMSYASEQNVPREVAMQRKIQKIEDTTEKASVNQELYLSGGVGMLHTAYSS